MLDDLSVKSRETLVFMTFSYNVCYLLVLDSKELSVAYAPIYDFAGFERFHTRQ